MQPYFKGHCILAQHESCHHTTLQFAGLAKFLPNLVTKFVAPRTAQSKHCSGGIYCRHTSTAIESWRNTNPATTPLCLQFAGLAKLLLMPEARSIKCKVPREMTGL